MRPRLELLYKTSSKTIAHTVKCVTGYSAHEASLRASISCHWHLLAKDYTLSKYISPTPELVFGWAVSLRGAWTSSHCQGSCDRSRCLGDPLLW